MEQYKKHCLNEKKVEYNDTKNNKIVNDSVSKKKIILNKKQQKSLDEFKLGSAESSKSITFHQIIKYYKNNNINVGVSISALLIGLKIINSFLGIKLAKKSIDQLYLIKIRELKVLIIDEISIINNELFDRKSKEQFEGLPIVFTGDFCQLKSINV